MKELIKKLTSSFGPAGNEEEIRAVIEQEIEKYADEHYTDKLGNLIAVKKGSGQGKKVMLAAHMDEIGLLITHIDDNGFLRFTNIGGINPHRLPGVKVIFANDTTGTIGVEKLDKVSDLKMSKLFIDIGAENREEALKKVNIGDSAVYYRSYTEAGNKVIANALDDRIGCVVLIETLKQISETLHDIYFVFTVQEEVGARGAKTAAYKIDPDLAVAVDVTATGDTPEAPTMAVSLNQGTAIKIKDQLSITHPWVKNLLISTAEKYNIKFQLEVLERGGTDAGTIHLTKEGIPSGTISIPSRYIHSPAEMVDLNDVQASIDLLVNFLKDNID